MGRGGGRQMGGGMGQGRGVGQGGGGRRMGGMGMGRGRGVGMGAGLGGGPVPIPQHPVQGLTKDDELGALRQQAEAMNWQMQQIRERMAQLQQAGQGEMTATVDSEKCTGCGLCVQVCPVEAIGLQHGVASVNAQTCTGCGACVDVCPNGAISVA